MVASRALPDATRAATTSVLGFITAPSGVRAQRTQCAPVSPQWGDSCGLRHGELGEGYLSPDPG
jgi:hypothetical protein